MGDIDGEPPRSEARKLAQLKHQETAENTYPTWNSSIDAQFKNLAKADKTKAFKPDTLDHYLLKVYLPELKRHGNVLKIRQARDKDKTATRGAQHAADGGGEGAGGAADENSATRVVQSAPSRRLVERAALDDAPDASASARKPSKSGGADTAGKDADKADKTDKDDEDDHSETDKADNSETDKVENVKKSRPNKANKAGSDKRRDQQANKEPEEEEEIEASTLKKKRKSAKRTKRDERGTESEDDAEESAQPSKKIRRSSTSAVTVDDAGDSPTRRVSRHFSISASPILTKFSSFEHIRSDFQKKIWARDGVHRRDGAPDRLLNWANLMQAATEGYSKPRSRELVEDFKASQQDPSDQ